MTARRPKPPEDLPDPLRGCMCRVCTGTITVDLPALVAVPDHLVDAFEQASFEAAHACTTSWPIADENAYIRGGLAAVTAEIEKRVRAKVAAEIERHANGTPVWSAATLEAASIARGEG